MWRFGALIQARREKRSQKGPQLRPQPKHLKSPRRHRIQRAALGDIAVTLRNLALSPFDKTSPVKGFGAFSPVKIGPFGPIQGPAISRSRHSAGPATSEARARNMSLSRRIASLNTGSRIRWN